MDEPGARPGLTATRALAVQLAFASVAFLPWLSPESVYDSAVSVLLSQLFAVSFFVFPVLSLVVLVIGVRALSADDPRERVRARVAVAGAIVVAVAVTVEILAVGARM